MFKGVSSLALAIATALSISYANAVPILDEAEIAKVHEAVRDRLRDPSSAIISDVAAGGEGDGIPVNEDGAFFPVCGYVNARNGFGGYTGKQPFYGTGIRAIRRDNPTSYVFIFRATAVGGNEAAQRHIYDDCASGGVSGFKFN